MSTHQGHVVYCDIKDVPRIPDYRHNMSFNEKPKPSEYLVEIGLCNEQRELFTGAFRCGVSTLTRLKCYFALGNEIRIQIDNGEIHSIWMIKWFFERTNHEI